MLCLHILFILKYKGIYAMKISYLSLTAVLAIFTLDTPAIAGIYYEGENIYKGQRSPSSNTEVSGYVDLGVGGTFIEDTSSNNSSGRISTSSDSKIIGRVEVGGYVGGFRAGLEYAYRSYDFDSKAFNSSGVSISTLERTVNVHTGLVNAYYDFDIGMAIKPYLGAGIGAAYISSSLDSGDNTFFAAQGIGGLEYQVDNTTSLYADYRYTYIDASYRVTAPGISNSTDLSSNNATVGLRFRF